MKSIFPIICIVLGLALFFLFVRPLYSDVSVIRTDIKTYNVALDNSKDLQLTRDALLATYKSISVTDKERLLKFLPNGVDNIGLILEIEQIAKSHNMTLKDIRFDTEKPGTAQAKSNSSVAIKANDPTASKTYGVFPFEFTTEGSYDDFVVFLKDIERNLRVVDVKSVSFTVPPRTTTKNPDGPNPDIFSYTLDIETYWLK